MYTLKQIPEDFIVIESLDLSISEGNYYYFKLQKTNLTTNYAIKLISEQIRIPIKDISYAGNKDKQAITTQTISVKSYHDLSNLSLNEESLTLTYLNKGDHPISLGDLSSNYFEITIRNISKLPILQDTFPNYFDEQRFSKNNSVVGKLLVKKDFKRASELLSENNHISFNKQLEKNPTNYVGAITSISRKILMIYLHSYQSKLFNEILSSHIKENYPHKLHEFSFGNLSFTNQHDDKEFPLIGFDTDTNSEILAILQKESITLRDFIIRQLPNLSMEGTTRNAFVKVNKLSLSELQEDELNNGKKKCKISFQLPPGSYATMFIKAIFKDQYV